MDKRESKEGLSVTKSGMKIFSEIFKIEKKPAKGLMPFDSVVLAYMALTLLVILFTYT